MNTVVIRKIRKLRDQETTLDMHVSWILKANRYGDINAPYNLKDQIAKQSLICIKRQSTQKMLYTKTDYVSPKLLIQLALNFLSVYLYLILYYIFIFIYSYGQLQEVLGSSKGLMLSGQLLVDNFTTANFEGISCWLMPR